MSNKFFLLCTLLLFCFAGCTKAQVTDSVLRPTPEKTPAAEVAKIQNPGRVVHILVALCDNLNQGIVPVPKALGNGEDPQKNLYWGAAFGIKTFFSRSKSWTLLETRSNPKENVLERLVFKHKTENVFLVADAYRGSKMRETIDDFFASVTGAMRENIKVGNETLQVAGGANLVAFIGHNGLMDFELERDVVKKDSDPREAVILACASRNYFSEHLKKTSAVPLLWTTNLMAPEAYILHDALDGWTRREMPEQVRTRAAAAYAKYQRISVKAARGLLVTGW